MNKIPTAEEFLKQNFESNAIDSNILIEFAKLHVEAALKSASNNVNYDGFNFASIEIDKDSIINAYPLDQIK